MKLSVVIVNYNVQYFLEQCLHVVLKASSKVESEIFVVDNNSVDGSVAMLQKKFPSVKVIANKENLGFSKANNQAIRVASGEYILLLNPDTVVEEDTFEKVIHFMDSHPDAGGLGVKMIDGTGKFLPESKRGLPTPMIAFYKMFGFAKLFPRSRTFGKYHLSYLDANKTHQVDVLSGAFMLIRKKVFDSIGLLDENFFMYGEDIDLSYRITQAGYKNYYFPETRIIHYKGESTKKSSVNYVFVFYNAMIIFAHKHFSQKNASLFSFLIKSAIYLRASLSVMARVFKTTVVPVIDVLILFGGMWFLKEYWGKNMIVTYPAEFMHLAVPAYILTWITSVYLSGGYDQPVKLAKVVRGVISGTVIILVGYALLPEAYRFSRALILLGTAWASASMVTWRLLLNILPVAWFKLDKEYRKRLLIVANADEGNRVLSLLKVSGSTHNFIGFSSFEANGSGAVNGQTQDEYHRFFLGGTEKFKELIEVYKIDEVIFCARDISSNEIIRLMSTAGADTIEYKIAPPESLFIIGSNSIENTGELYVVDINSIAKRVNKRNKRMLDIGLSGTFLALSPVLIFLQKKPGAFLSNIFRVFAGKFSWVGYYTLHEQFDEKTLPKIKPGILTPLDSLTNKQLDMQTINRLNSLYAKDYHVAGDLMTVWKAIRFLGGKKIK